MYALFGEILFETLTSPESFTATSEYSFAEHKVVEASPRLQWMANELETISLDMHFSYAFTNPLVQLLALRAAAELHQAMALVFGNGIHRGYFVIERLEETHRQMADDGSYVDLTVRVELKEWVPGADWDPAAPPQPQTSPPGIVSSAGSSTATSSAAAATPFNANQPIGPHNLLPTAAIVQLNQAGAGPGVTYSPATYAQPGVSGVVNNPPATAPSAASQFSTVPASQIVRAG
jgi:phage protein U